MLFRSTGILKRCYASTIHQNIFKNIEQPIMNLAVGNECNSLFCLNSSHFMALGTIPAVPTPSYAELRNRNDAKWYSTEMEDFLNGKLKQNNKEYSLIQKFLVNVIGKFDKIMYRLFRFFKGIKKR